MYLYYFSTVGGTYHLNRGGLVGIGGTLHVMYGNNYRRKRGRCDCWTSMLLTPNPYPVPAHQLRHRIPCTCELILVGYALPCPNLRKIRLHIGLDMFILNSVSWYWLILDHGIVDQNSFRWYFQYVTELVTAYFVRWFLVTFHTTGRMVIERSYGKQFNASVQWQIQWQIEQVNLFTH